MIKVNVNTSQMEQWSVVSNSINYDQYKRNQVDHCKLDVRALEPKVHKGIYSTLEVT